MAPLFFWAISAVIVVSSLAVVLMKNIVHCALFLIVSFLGIAGIYAMLQADFLAAVQVLVYVGAIAVLIVFAVMLTRRGDIKKSNLFNKYAVIAGLTSIAFLVTVVEIITGSKFDVIESTGESIVRPLATALMGNYVVAFEAAAVLLLVALIGAIILAKGVKKEQ
jgi:NADH-quinone oxidoreductase subunit J